MIRWESEDEEEGMACRLVVVLDASAGDAENGCGVGVKHVKGTCSALPWEPSQSFGLPSTSITDVHSRDGCSSARLIHYGK